MNFHQRLMSRCSLTTAKYAPIYVFESFDGEVIKKEWQISEDEKRLYEDCTNKKIFDSGIPLKFVSSPDSSPLQTMLVTDADLQQAESVIKERGFDTSKPFDKQNNTSHVDVVANVKQSLDNNLNNSNNSQNEEN